MPHPDQLTLPPNTEVFDPTSPSVLKRNIRVIKRGRVIQQINCWLDQKENDNCLQRWLSATS
jgi:hypothetical protein